MSATKKFYVNSKLEKWIPGSGVEDLWRVVHLSQGNENDGNRDNENHIKSTKIIIQSKKSLLAVKHPLDRGWP